MNVVRVDGKNQGHKVFIYALSTCVWCKRTKEFLKDSGIAYEFVDVDLAEGEEREKIDEEMSKVGGFSYPTVVVDGKKVIRGFRVEEIKEALGI
jgi:glutaredoxin